MKRALGNDLLHFAAALGTLGNWSIGKLLHNLCLMSAFLTFIFIYRHYKFPPSHIPGVSTPSV